MLKKYKALAFALTFIMLFNMALPAFSAGSIDQALGDVGIKDGGHQMDYLIAGPGVQRLNYAYYEQENPIDGSITEVPAYCVNPNDPGVGQVGDYTVSANEVASDPKIVGIASNSYPHMSLDALGLKDKYEGYYAGKIAIWCYLLKWDINNLKVNPSSSDQAAAQRVLKATKYAYQQGTTWTQHVKPALTVTPNSSQATTDARDSNYLSQSFTICSDTWVVDGKVQVKIKAAQETFGAKIVDADTNASISNVTMKQDGNKFWGKFKVLYPKAQVEGKTGNVQFDLSGTVYKYEVFYGVSYDKSKQDYLVDTDPKYYANSFGTSSFSPTAETPDEGTGIEIIKYETGTTQPLTGAVVEVIDPDGVSVGTFTSDKQGKIFVPCVKMGNYTIKELIAPKYHLLDGQTVNVDVRYNEVSKVSLFNQPYGDLTLEKLDAETGRGIAGAVFQIKNIVTGQTQSVTTEATGQVHLTDLLPGAYEIKETFVPEPYILDSTPQTVNVISGEASSIALTNQAKPRVKIIKIDQASNIVLSGATFEVYRDGELLGTYQTDQLGEINLTVKPGTIWAKEVAAAPGYVLNSYPQQIEVKAGQTTTPTLIFGNLLKPGISLVKLDSSTMEPMANVQFLISKVGGSFSKEYTTGTDGIINLEGLEPGAYTVTEQRTNDTHLIDDGSRIIQINAGENAQFIFTNTRKPAVDLIKLDSNGNPLPGCTFKIGLIGNDGVAYSSYVTDINGRIHIDGWNCKRGQLSIIETASANGYVLDSREYRLELFAGKTSQLVVENKKKPDLVIIKTDTEGKPITGATFTVKKADGGTVATVTTEAGQAQLIALDPGVYQVQEQFVPEPYILDPTPQLITLEPNRTGIVQFKNITKPSFELLKTDSNGKPIPGAVFTISEKNGEAIGDYTTDQDGKISLSQLKANRYYVIQEKSVPDQYILNTKPYEVFLTPGKLVSITIQNQKKPDLTIKKIDSITSSPIAKVKFQVWYAVNGSLDGTLKSLGTYYTDEKGEITFTKQAVGWYRITELQPAPGYEIKEPVTQDVFLEADTAKTVTFENTPQSALIIKKVDENGTPLSGAKFKVRYLAGTSGTGGTVIAEDTTSVNGTIILTSLKPGTYIIEETQAPSGYTITGAAKTVYISGKEQAAVTVEFVNSKYGSLLIKKLDSITKEPISGVIFKVTDSSGALIGSNNGQYTTDGQGTVLVSGIAPNTTLNVQEIKAKEGYLLDDTSKTIQIKDSKTYTLEFLNQPQGGLQITKLDNDTRKPIAGVEFSISKMNGATIGTYTTDNQGIIYLPTLSSGWYTVIEQRAKGYILDNEPHNIKVTEGKLANLTLTNRKKATILIHKVDSETGDGIENVTFLLYDSGRNPIGEYTTDQDGYVYIDDQELTAGRYYLRETKPGEGYQADDNLKTVWVKAGQTTEIKWKNTAIYGQIQITKKSADHNPINGLAAGSLLEGATFEIYNKAGDVVDTIVSDQRGRAVSKPLPLGRYTCREVKAPSYYAINPTVLDAELEFPGQILKFQMQDFSVATGVSITKRGYQEVMPNQSIRYTFSRIANESTMSLNSFYWRDTLPTDAVRLQKVITGSYNQKLRYKIVYKTNLYNDYQILADNLDTSRVYTFEATPAALGLASNEYVTEIMYVFGAVKSGFAQVEAPAIYCYIVPYLPNGYRFTNKADAGGQYQGQWIMAADRWVTSVYAPKYKSPTLPRTGY